MIGSFSHGELSLADLSRNDSVVYPIMHVVPEGFPYQVEDQGGSYRQMRFRIIFMDRPRDKSDNKADYQKEVISDCDQLQRDLLAIIKNGSLFGGGVDIVDAGEGEPFVERFENVLAGVENSITLGFGWTLDACDVPGTFQQPPGTIAEVVGSNPLYMLRSVYDPNSIGDPVVFTVNGTAPDSSGNVTVTTGAATVVRTTAGWVTNGTQVLSSGQAGFDSDLLLTKIGDGVTTYANLEYDHATQLHETAANFAVSNPVLAHGQIAIEQDTFKMKVGDEFGTAYNSLPYIVQDANIVFTDVTTNNASTSMHGFLKKLDNDSTHFMDGQGNWNSPDLTNNDILGMQALGSQIKIEPIGYTAARISANQTLSALSGVAVFLPGYLAKTQTLTGIGWYQVTQGNYTASNYNGIGIYSYSGGTWTLVASSTDDGNIWKAASGSWNKKAFTTPYVAAAGIYALVMLHSRSAVVTIPIVGGFGNVLSSAVMPVDLTNSAALQATVSGQTSLPASIAASGLTPVQAQRYLFAY